MQQPYMLCSVHIFNIMTLLVGLLAAHSFASSSCSKRSARLYCVTVHCDSAGAMKGAHWLSHLGPCSLDA